MCKSILVTDFIQALQKLRTSKKYFFTFRCPYNNICYLFNYQEGSCAIVISFWLLIPGKRNIEVLCVFCVLFFFCVCFLFFFPCVCFLCFVCFLFRVCMSFLCFMFRWGHLWHCQYSLCHSGSSGICQQALR